MTSVGGLRHGGGQDEAHCSFMRTTGDEYVRDPSALGGRVRDLRRRRGLTQGELAAGALSTAYVSRIEAGQRRPEPKVVQLLAERLGTTPDYLLTGLTTDEADEARLALRYAELALHSGESADAEAQLQRLLAADAIRLGPLRPHAELLRARALENLGRLDEAIHSLEELRELPTGADFLDVHVSLSRCYREAGDLARSIEIGEQALRDVEALGLAGSDDAIRLTVTVAAAYFERGDGAYAAHLCQKALEDTEQTASPAARAATLWNSSVIASERGRTQLAIDLAERALGLLSEGDDDRAVARLRLQLGLILLREQPPDVDGAEVALGRARPDLAETASAVDVARCDAALALARLHRGAPDEARALALQAMELAGDASLVVADCEIVLGQVSAAEGDADDARRYYRSAVATLTAASGDRNAATAWFELAALLEDAGDVEGALQAYRSAAASAGVRPAATVRPGIRASRPRS
jgi:tetratricopeptide (TPR) repeat protein